MSIQAACFVHLESRILSRCPRDMVKVLFLSYQVFALRSSRERRQHSFVAAL